jgi:hypothetical protein
MQPPQCWTTSLGARSPLCRCRYSLQRTRACAESARARCARLRTARAAEKAAAVAAAAASGTALPSTELAAWERNLNTFLVADFFLVVLLGLLLIAGVIEQSYNKTTAIADVFFKLWPVLVQPALGVLMAASVASGAAGFARDKGWIK